VSDEWYEKIGEESKIRSNPAGSIKRQLAVGIRAYRKERKLSQTELAVLASTTQTTVANLEAEKGNPTLAVILRVLEALGREPLMMWREKNN